MLALKEIYKEINVPFIFVYTQDVMCNFDFMKDYVKKELNDNNLIIVDILAKDMKLKNGNIIKAYGIEELKSETKKKISDIKNTAFYKKFYNDCLNKLYNLEKIDYSYVLNKIIENIILKNRIKYNFGEIKKFDEKLDADILCKIKEINDIFVINFNESLKIISELVREYQAESNIRANRKDRNCEIELNNFEKVEKEKIIHSCDLSKLQKDIQKLIIGEYGNCLNKFIDEMFEKELTKTYNNCINSILIHIDI